MKITTKQARVLDNLDRIVVRTIGKKTVSTLDGEDCRFQLFSLGARGLAARNHRGEWIKLADPDGIAGAPRWPMPDRVQEKAR